MSSARRPASATQLDAEADFGKGDRADVEQLERLRPDEGDDLGLRPGAAQLGEDVGVEQPARHNETSRTGIGSRSGFNLDVAIGRSLHRGDQRVAGAIALEAAELFRRDDDDFIAAVHGDMLRPLAADTPHQFAETRLGVLQQPMAGFQFAEAPAGFCQRF